MNSIKSISRLILPPWLWKSIRRSQILRQHKKVADFWHPIIDSYFDNRIEKYFLVPKKEISSKKIIWQYWGQGINTDSLPEIIQICFDSVDKYKGDYEVIRLTDSSISEYIELPKFVWDKKENNPEFTRTFFSDLLRLALLKAYGGVWLDATILLTRSLPKKYEKFDYFAFQRSDEEENKSYWESVYAYYFGWHRDFKVRFLSSIMFAQKDSIVIASLLDLMLSFWKTQNHVPDYFCFQILYNELMQGKLAGQQCVEINDCIPHVLQTKINGNYEWASFEEAIEQTSMHKMAYFDTRALAKLKRTLKELEIL